VRVGCEAIIIEEGEAGEMVEAGVVALGLVSEWYWHCKVKGKIRSKGTPRQCWMHVCSQEASASMGGESRHTL
jgi:hypothetical protein